MKKVILFIIACILANMVCAQQADTTIVFNKLAHDFGAIMMADEEQEYLFEFTNKGTQPVTIQKVTTSCGCTTSGWTKEPVSQGKKGYVKVVCHPSGFTVFNKSVTVNIAGGNPETVVLHIRGNVTDNMILINGGSYKMGDFTGISFANERPVHDVFLDSFYMSKYQLTVGEFRDFVEKSGYITDCEKKKGGKVFLIENGIQTFLHDSLASWKYVGYVPDDHQPVTFVSWVDAINYCNWRSKKDNLQCCYRIIGDSVFWDKSAKGYRLLTEAEWEFVARSGGKNYKFSWGNDSLPMINDQKAANIKDETYKKAMLPGAKLKSVWKGYEDGHLYTSPVGSFAPNDLGIYDICGNVYEWCWDWKDDNYYSESPVRNPDGPATGEKRVCRNVGYACPIEQIGTTHRGAAEPNSFGDNMGFRIGRSK